MCFKKILCILICAIVTLSFSGCENENSTSQYIILNGSNYTESTVYETDKKILSSNKAKISNNSSAAEKQRKKAASNNKDTSSSTLQYKTHSVKSVNDMLVLDGRAFLSSDTVCLDWACSSFGFSADCQGDISVTVSSVYGKAYVKIYVDGKQAFDEPVTVSGESPGNIKIASGLQCGIHSVKIVRICGCEAGYVNINSITISGELISPSNAGYRKITFLGDDSMLGLGVTLPNSYFSGNFNTENVKYARKTEFEDNTKSYPYIAANALKSRYEIISRLGSGLGETYFMDKESGLLPNIYMLNSLRINAGNAALDIPTDIFVIDAGYNDYKLHAVGDELNVSKNAYDTFRRLKSINPLCKIIWCYNFINSEVKFEQQVEEVISTLGGASRGYYTLKLDYTKRKGFPSESEHKTAAEKLVSLINTID